MGLDMMLYAREVIEEGDDVSEDARQIEIGTWRKHPDLHSYIETLWRAETGSTEDFNCIDYKLSRKQIIDIILLTVTETMPKSKGGFFFSESKLTDISHTITLMGSALSYIDKHTSYPDDVPEYEIFYSSWW
jgi:hypothetical protein